MANDAVRDALSELVRGYVSLLETGRDRMLLYGGECDPVDVMERDDPYLREARAALALPAGAEPVAWRDVQAERVRQVSVEGWTPAHDDQHNNGELAVAASCYAQHGSGMYAYKPARWPWEHSWWKPSTNRRDLVKAGALILAEIERLDRVDKSPNQQRQSEAGL